MSFLSLVGVEFKKIKRSKIFLILFAATLILWIPSILNADMNFNMQAEGISPENNFFIQGFMGMAWFMFPASMGYCSFESNRKNKQRYLKDACFTHKHRQTLLGKVCCAACFSCIANFDDGWNVLH